MKATPARLLLLAVAVVLLDQLTKLVVMQTLPLQTSIPVLGDVVRLTHIKNQGIAFGLFSGRRVPLSVVSLVAMIVVLVAFRKLPAGATWPRVAMASILGGATGNLIDRIRYREVVDFIDVGIGSVRWPVFNVADIAVTAGVFVFVLSSLGRRDDGESAQDAEAVAEEIPSDADADERERITRSSP